MRHLPLLLLLGCWPRWERELDERTIEMTDHQVDAIAAVEAISMGKLDEARAAGKGLARPDEVPYLPDEARPMLDAVRARGAAIAEATTREEAADHLIALAAECQACHQHLGVTAKAKGTDLSLAWLALLWEDEAAWPHGGGAWTDRRETLRGVLTASEAAPPDEPTDP